MPGLLARLNLPLDRRSTLGWVQRCERAIRRFGCRWLGCNRILLQSVLDETENRSQLTGNPANVGLREEQMWKIAISVFASAVLLVSAANAQFTFTRQEVLSFESAKMSIDDFLAGNKGEPVTLAGYLRLPKSDGKNPVVVLFHGAGGLGGEGGSVNDWSRVLNEAGIGTFAVDSFSGRGIATLADAGRVSPVSRVVDAYRALELLSKHPLVDANKIVVMGFSHGGGPALYSSLVRFQKLRGKPDLQFAAHISVYGGCGTTFRQDEVLTQRPVLLLHGTADNWVPIGPCREYAARLTKVGMNVRLIEYPDAYHVFDGPALREPVQLPQAVTGRNYRFTEIADGSLVNAATKQPLSPTDPCFEKGVTIQYNEAAAKKAHEDVKAFLQDAFSQK
jgi:dienelactone hydrolase